MCISESEALTDSDCHCACPAHEHYEHGSKWSRRTSSNYQLPQGRGRHGNWLVHWLFESELTEFVLKVTVRVNVTRVLSVRPPTNLMIGHKRWWRFKDVTISEMLWNHLQSVMSLHICGPSTNHLLCLTLWFNMWLMQKIKCQWIKTFK